MSDVTSFEVTGDWRHIVDDGMVDGDNLPDEVPLTGKVVFKPVYPTVATAGVPVTAYTLGPVTALIAGGVLNDLQGRPGVMLAGKVGEHTVRWSAETSLRFQEQKVDYPRVTFDLTEDVRLTGIITQAGPSLTPIVVDPRIEALAASVESVNLAVVEAEGHASTAAEQVPLAKAEADRAIGLAGAQDEHIAGTLEDPQSATHAAFKAVGNATYADKAGTVATVAGQNATHLWMPPEQEAQPGLASWTAQQFIDGYETLRAANPEYVTREQIGADAEGKPIWAYFFTPAAYENTVLTFNQHGYEKVAIWSNMRFAEMLTNDWATSPRLAAFRARTRLVVVPFITWYGVDQGKRVTFGGVDPNRNWDWKWDLDPGTEPGTEVYKGTAPFSEPETQALRDFVGVLTAQGGLTAALDMHSVGFTQQAEPYYCYFGLPDRELANTSWAADLARELAPDPLPRYLHGSAIPKASSWVQSQGIRSLTVEYYQSFGEVGLDATNIRYGIRAFANTIMRAAELPSLDTTRAKGSTIVRTFDYQPGSAANVFVALGAGSAQAAEIPEFTHEFKPPCAGIILWTGQILLGQGSAGRIYLQAVAGSDSLKTWWANSPKTWDISYLDITGPSDRVLFPFTVARPVTDSDGVLFPTRLSLRASSTGSPYPPQVIRYQASMVFIPTDGTDRFERWTATDRAGAGAMQFATGL